MSIIARFANVIRLALFSLGYGLTGALVGGTLNRVLIADLGYAESLVGLLFAIPLLISPLRIWLGYRSDAYTIFGRRREPYVVVGALLSGVGVIFALILAVQNTTSSWLLVIGMLVGFAIHGFGRNLSHTTFQALLADKFTGNQRARIITGFEVATLLGLVVGAGGLGRAFETFDPGRLISVTIMATTVTLILSLIAAIRQEQRGDSLDAAAEQARSMSFKQVLKDVVLADPQVRLFFTIILFTFIGTLAQDVLLEPYGALVLNMEVGETTRLTAFWGVGVMIAMLLAGQILIRWLGYMTIMRLGMVASILVFGGVIFAGSTGSASLFQSLVLVMGLGTGLAGAGMLTGIINFTTTIRAGMLLGVWGVANLLGRAVGGLVGGTVVDVVRSSTGDALLAYSVVFGLEIIMLVTALVMTTRLDMARSRARQEEIQQRAVDGVLAAT